MKRLLPFFLLLIVVSAPALVLAQEEKHEKPEESSTKELVWKIVNFVLLFGGIAYFIRKPAGEFFAARTAAIQKDMAEAREARQKADQRLTEIEQRLSRLGDEIGALRAEAAREDAVQQERLRQASEAEAAKILSGAEAEITTMARSARLDLKSFAAKLAVDLAEERIRGRMNPEVQGRLLGSYVRDLNTPEGGN